MLWDERKYTTGLNGSKRSKSRSRSCWLSFLTIEVLCIGSRQPVHHEYAPEGQNITKKYYLEVPRRLRGAVRRKTVRSVGITQLAAESRQFASPFFILNPTFLDEVRNISGSPGSLHVRSWFLGFPKDKKLDILIYYTWKWKCDEHLPHTHI